jgi:hypothetical protein
LEKEAVAGRYEVRFETLRDATKQDKIENLAANLTAAVQKMSAQKVKQRE